MTQSSETSDNRYVILKKCLDLDAFLDVIISFSYLEKKNPIFRFVYKQ